MLAIQDLVGVVQESTQPSPKQLRRSTRHVIRRYQPRISTTQKGFCSGDGGRDLGTKLFRTEKVDDLSPRRMQVAIGSLDENSSPPVSPTAGDWVVAKRCIARFRDMPLDPFDHLELLRVEEPARHGNLDARLERVGVDCHLLNPNAPSWRL
jgi:hypothetical protein